MTITAIPAAGDGLPAATKVQAGARRRELIEIYKALDPTQQEIILALARALDPARAQP